ncbi:MAG: methyltransferase regulatory domain-containing protein [Deltaproteobacteria bacterium]|nr:methyltransferase regulatory domain-containing protein [Deltaproteobacteria bacterium]
MSTYDAVPYTSLPYPRTHPDHLHAMARLFGVRAASVTACRVLEIGCGSAGNLVGMAVDLPEATFVGVDPSEGEIARGRALAEAVGSTNVTLHVGSVDAVDGPFDYVIAHGVLSWVAPEVRRAILEQGRARLSQNGVFYASYNVFPGWHLRCAVRGMLQQHGSEGDPTARLRDARTFLDWLSARVGRDGGAFRAVLDEEVERLAGADDAYFFHEHLEEHNHPLWFRDFAAEARELGLQWLCEADPAATVRARAAPRAFEALRAVAGDDPISIEQHFDFLRGRSFRASLLVHLEHVRREVSGEELVDLVAASRGPGDLWIEDATLAEALARLSSRWPDGAPIAELSDDPAALADALAPLHAAGVVELRARVLGLAGEGLERPWASPLARLQARGPARVTNLRHEPIDLSADERAVLVRLDATAVPAADEAIVRRLAQLAFLRDGPR